MSRVPSPGPLRRRLTAVVLVALAVAAVPLASVALLVGCKGVLRR